MIGFLNYDHSTLYKVLNQFQFTGFDDHPALLPKDLATTAPLPPASVSVSSSANRS